MLLRAPRGTALGGVGTVGDKLIGHRRRCCLVSERDGEAVPSKKVTQVSYFRKLF